MARIGIHTLTVLMDATKPEFIIEAPTLRVGSPKPVINSIMVGYLVSEISHFWAMWENEGNTIHDIVNPLFNGLAAPGSIWEPGKNGVCVTGSVANDITVPAVVLSGNCAVDFLAKSGGVWQHICITNDPVLGLSHYINGVLQTSVPYVPVQTITNLFFYAGLNAGSLEYMRTWARSLNLVEIQTLVADPYCMFGLTQQTMDEIITIVNFMKPTKERWDFV